VDVYHGSSAPASASLLTQSGVSAYTRLLDAFASSEQQDKSAGQLTNTLSNASAALKSAYLEAAASLPRPLQAKDWTFSVSSGKLVVTPGEDDLSPQDLADLQRAFALAKVEPAAKQVAAAMISLALMRKSAPDPAPLSPNPVEVDEATFADVVDLRAYVTGTAPSAEDHPTAPPPADRREVPTLLGGMYLGDLTSARPDFLRPDGSVATEDADASEGSILPEPDGLLHGHCTCGTVRFTVENDFEYAFYCHCSRCRRRTGSAFAAIAGIRTEQVQLISGRDDLLIQGDCADGYDARCRHCHTFLFSAVRARQYLHVALGVLVDAPSRVPDHHIYVGSKAPWYRITDGLPQYDELP
jgi:hypothetical protein